MHSILATFFAVLLSFCHHSPNSHAMEASVSYNVDHPTRVLSFPGRQELARTVSYGGYAGSACSSCQSMNVSYSVR